MRRDTERCRGAFSCRPSSRNVARDLADALRFHALHRVRRVRCGVVDSPTHRRIDDPRPAESHHARRRTESTRGTTVKEPREPTTQAKEAVEANPHPQSSHRAPRQIAADASGPTAPRPAQSRPVRDVDPEQRIDAESAADVERRRAVKRSAHQGPTSTQSDADGSTREPASGTDDKRMAVRKPGASTP